MITRHYLSRRLRQLFDYGEFRIQCADGLVRVDMGLEA